MNINKLQEKLEKISSICRDVCCECPNCQDDCDIKDCEYSRILQIINE